MIAEIVKRILFKLWISRKAHQIEGDQLEIEKMRWELWGKYGD
jgi:hypothetical protein